MKVIAQAPTRLSLFGGGTDLPVYADRYGGVVITMAINLRQHIELEESKTFEIEDMPLNASVDFYKSALEEYGIFKVKSCFDTQIQSGLGSSASAMVAMLGAVNKLKGLGMTKLFMAEKAYDIEVNKLGLYGGKQDQHQIVQGGMNIIWFNGGNIDFNPVEHKRAEFIRKHILLFHIGENRKTPTIQNNLKTPSQEQINALHEVKKTATLAKRFIDFTNVKELGYLLNDAWNYKKKSNPLVTNKRIDDIYDLALSIGAYGGKLMGSGGGGFMFFMADPRDHSEIINELEAIGCKYTDFSIDWNGLETRLI